MIKNFMTLGTLTRGRELEEDLGRSDTMPFPEEDAIMMVYDGRPPLGRHRVSSLSNGTLTRCDWGHGDTGI
jgi:hypothetical protein